MPKFFLTEIDQIIQTQSQSQQQSMNYNRENETSPLTDSIADLELISGLIRTLSKKEPNWILIVCKAKQLLTGEI